ncbi:MAG: SMC-Scp complex subunit ScpB [Pseudomonadota bacterium]
MSTPEGIDNILEAVLLAAGEPVSIERLLEVFADEGIDRATLRDALARLQERYSGRGIELYESAGGWRIRVRAAMAPWVARLWPSSPPRYSRAVLETLALIAWRQPITRSEIEAVRGVSVNAQIVRTLQERGWIHVVGHKEAPGRPALYATTRRFLDDFGLRRLEDLPSWTLPEA